MKETLITILATGTIPADLVITYDDMHGLWGGTTMTIRGDGSIEHHTKAPQVSAAEVRHTTIDQPMVLDLVRLLVQLDAWEQRIPARPPVPDESRASLTISVNGMTSRIWEPFNHLAATNRLIQIKTWLEQA